jgi:hypothetical protein
MSLVALLTTTLVLAACSAAATPSGAPGSGPTSAPAGEVGAVGHATGATDVILRTRQGGGMIANFAATSVPEFTLYGDGTVLYQVAVDPDAPAPVGPPRLAVARMNEEQMQALLQLAIGAGGLGDAKDLYVNPFVADAGDTTFEIATDEVTKTVTAQALFMADDPDNPNANSPDAPAMSALKALYDSIVPFADQVARGNATDGGFYAAPAYRATLLESEAQGEMLDWPWPDVTLDDFIADPNSGFRSAILTPDQALALSPTPEGGVYAVPVVGPDRVPYQVSLRPLLPDEIE